MQSKTMKLNPPDDKKKRYRSPRLAVYGDIRRLTMGKNRTGAEAGAGTPKTKTTGIP